MNIGMLYHWSPVTRRPAILADGLVPGSEHTVAAGPLDYVCLGFSASGAWALSGRTVPETRQSWDLWQVQVDCTDNVTVRPEFGPTMCEVMVRNRIPSRRMWLAATRTPDHPEQ